MRERKRRLKSWVYWLFIVAIELLLVAEFIMVYGR